MDVLDHIAPITVDPSRIGHALQASHAAGRSSEPLLGCCTEPFETPKVALGPVSPVQLVLSVAPRTRVAADALVLDVVVRLLRVSPSKELVGLHIPLTCELARRVELHQDLASQAELVWRQKSTVGRGGLGHYHCPRDLEVPARSGCENHSHSIKGILTWPNFGTLMSPVRYFKLEHS